MQIKHTFNIYKTEIAVRMVVFRFTPNHTSGSCQTAYFLTFSKAILKDHWYMLCNKYVVSNFCLCLLS